MTAEEVVCEIASLRRVMESLPPRLRAEVLEIARSH